jgi:hypothetical protein
MTHGPQPPILAALNGGSPPRELDAVESAYSKLMDAVADILDGPELPPSEHERLLRLYRAAARRSRRPALSLAS